MKMQNKHFLTQLALFSFVFVAAHAWNAPDMQNMENLENMQNMQNIENIQNMEYLRRNVPDMQYMRNMPDMPNAELVQTPENTEDMVAIEDTGDMEDTADVEDTQETTGDAEDVDGTEGIDTMEAVETAENIETVENEAGAYARAAPAQNAANDDETAERRKALADAMRAEIPTALQLDASTKRVKIAFGSEKGRVGFLCTPRCTSWWTCKTFTLFQKDCVSPKGCDCQRLVKQKRPNRSARRPRPTHGSGSATHRPRPSRRPSASQ